jgi:outer membrane biosynthesis protein TonB
MREPAFGFTAPQGDVAGESSWEINHRVMADRDALRLCYQRELARDATLGGRVNVAFTIRRDGHVAGIVVTGFHPDLDACVCRTFAAMVFPPGDGDSHVRYPLLYGQ